MSSDARATVHDESAVRKRIDVEIRRAESAVCLVRLHRQGYFSLLRDKLHWGDLSTRE